MRKYTIPQNNMTLTYLLGDHLGSTSLTVDAATSEVIETRYKAWGEVSYTTPNKTLPTRNNFTGQYSYVADEATDLGNSGFGLMFYQSRFYDPGISQFTSPDILIPNPSNTLDWNRYSYARYNPLRYTDPSGHFTEDEIAEMWGFKNKNDEKFRKLWDKWGKSGFQDVLLNAKLGDIISFKFDNGVLLQLMFGQMDDGSLGFWNIDTKEYVSKEYADTFFDNSTSWALFTRDTAQDSKRDDNFEDYTPTAWKKGDRLEVPILDYYWAGGVDNNPSYVKIKTDLNANLAVDIGVIILDKLILRFATPATVKEWVQWAPGWLATSYGFTDIWQGGYIDRRIPIIHP